MNATQIGDLIKSVFLAIGVSSTVVGYFTAESWTLIGGIVLAAGSLLVTVFTKTTPALIAAVADNPAVAEIKVKDRAMARAIPSSKVVPLS